MKKELNSRKIITRYADLKKGTRGYQRQIELIRLQAIALRRERLYKAALKRRDETEIAARQEDIDSLIEFVDLEIEVKVKEVQEEEIELIKKVT